LSANPENAIREQLTQNSGIAKRATRYLDHLIVQRVLQLPDTKERIEKLVPYFVKNASWGMKLEARYGIVACGETAGPILLNLLNGSAPDEIKEEIIRMFGEIKYRGCISALIEILEEQDMFWSKQSLNKGWWNRNVESEETKARRHSYGLVLHAVSTLGALGDRRASAAIKQTKVRWESINFENPQIIEECEKALKEIAAEQN
jgi:HEAT repeat protein